MALCQRKATLCHYSALNIAFPSDRSPALAVFARVFSPAFAGAEEYAAGIWRSTLPFGLLWQVHKLNGDTLDGVPHDQITPPSWSWAALTSHG